MKTGLALAGGGLQAFAYVGVFKALDEMKIKVDYISGTSSGSVFAVFYSLGFSPEEMKEIIINHYKEFVRIKKRPIINIAKDFFFRKEISTEGLINGDEIEEKIAQIIGNKNISEIKFPVAIATVDTISTNECIFLSKNYKFKNEKIEYIYDIPIAKAIRASMAFPGIFTTCNFENYNFIDGGTKDNLPVKVLKDMGADRVISLNFDISNYEVSSNIMKVVLRAVDIFSQKDVLNAQNLADLAIEIDTQGTSLLEINDIEKCINIGYKAIKDNEDKIYKIFNKKLENV